MQYDTSGGAAVKRFTSKGKFCNSGGKVEGKKLGQVVVCLFVCLWTTRSGKMNVQMIYIMIR